MCNKTVASFQMILNWGENFKQNVILDIVEFQFIYIQPLQQYFGTRRIQIVYKYLAFIKIRINILKQSSASFRDIGMWNIELSNNNSIRQMMNKFCGRILQLIKSFSKSKLFRVM